MPTPRVIPLLLLTTLVSACRQDAPVQYRVPDVRILAIRSTVIPPGTDPLPAFTAADVAPGDRFRLDALVANPLNRDVTIAWYACVPPCNVDKSLGDLDAFENSAPSDGVYLIGVTSTTESVTIDTAAAPLITLLQGVVTATLDAAVTKPILQCNPSPVLQVVSIARAEGIAEAAVKLVRLNPTSELAKHTDFLDVYRLNFNPNVDAVVKDPTSVDPCTGGEPVVVGSTLSGKVTLCARAVLGDPNGSIQTFRYCDFTKSPMEISEQPEELSWQWYVTAGEIANSNFDGNATADNIDLTPPAGAFTLWVILRDGRGGSSWEKVTF